MQRVRGDREVRAEHACGNTQPIFTTTRRGFQDREKRRKFKVIGLLCRGKAIAIGLFCLVM